jgi:membrane-bound ClpP family serine protease
LLIGFVAFLLAVRGPNRRLLLVASILVLVVSSSFLFRGEGWQPAVNPWLALVLSTISAGFFWLIAVKVLEAARARPTHDLSQLIGEIGEAKSDIFLEGSVQVSGELWTARSESLIADGSQVRIIGREGFILLVEPYSKTKAS